MHDPKTTPSAPGSQLTAESREGATAVVVDLTRARIELVRKLALKLHPSSADRLDERLSRLEGHPRKAAEVLARLRAAMRQRERGPR